MSGAISIGVNHTFSFGYWIPNYVVSSVVAPSRRVTSMKKSERGEKVKWRVHFNQLIARPIPLSSFPSLIEKMRDDGLICLLHITGYQWYSGRYPITPKNVREIWGLSIHQWKRFMAWVIEEDPFDGGDEDDEV